MKNDKKPKLNTTLTPKKAEVNTLSHSDYKKGETDPLAQALLGWYKTKGRDLPWRVKGGAHEDAYAVWISEIMLQQTTVKTVIDYFERWMKRFPTLKILAESDLHDVLLMWQGLGYYTRAKKIHECARVLMEKHGGQFPQNRDELLKLPGIGPYTSSSICAFAFNQPETVVDGNVIRVIARLYGITGEINKNEIYELACAITPHKHGADYASAIMDLGATVCTPANPKCKVGAINCENLEFNFLNSGESKDPQTIKLCDCPWVDMCVAYREKLTSVIPLLSKPTKQNRSGILYLIQNKAGGYYIRKRSGKGLLSGLYEFPWHYEGETPFLTDFNDTEHLITHTFTHFHLTLKIVKATADTFNQNDDNQDFSFVQKKDLKNYAFPTLMKKVFKFLND